MQGGDGAALAITPDCRMSAAPRMEDEPLLTKTAAAQLDRYASTHAGFFQRDLHYV